jgi:hypothetical protein
VQNDNSINEAFVFAAAPWRNRATDSTIRAPFALELAQDLKTCGTNATVGLSQRRKTAEMLELWQISSIMGLTESWNLGGKLRAREQVLLRLESNHGVAES